MQKYRTWDSVLVAFYGLEKVKFKKPDPDTATVDARRIAEELGLTETGFYALAEKIGLPLAPRDTSTYRFMHGYNADLILEKSGDRFRSYGSRRRKVA